MQKTATALQPFFFGVLLAVFLLSPWIVSAQTSHPAYYWPITITGNTICPNNVSSMSGISAATGALINPYSAFIATSSAIDTSNVNYAFLGYSGTVSLKCINASSLAGYPADQYVAVWYAPADQLGTRIPAYYYHDFYFDGTNVPVVQSGGQYATSTIGTLCDNSFATSTGFFDSVGSSIANGFCRVSVFLFIPNEATVEGFSATWNSFINTEFPFSWITDTREILDSYVGTTSENFPSISIDLGSTTEILGFDSIEVISTTTISNYLSDSTRDSIKTLLASLFYLAAIGFIYRDLQRIWHKQ